MEVPKSEDTLLAISEDLAPCTLLPSSRIVTLSFSGLLSPPLQLQTNVSQCGGQLWPAGMVLSEYLIRHHLDELRGKKMFVRSEDFGVPRGWRMLTPAVQT